MRSYVVTSAAAAVGIAALTIVAGAGARPGASGAARSDPVQVLDSSRRLQVRPARLVWLVGAGHEFRFRELKPWRGWGAPGATARGRLSYPDCDPDCASGGFAHSPVRIELRKIREVQGTLLYRRAVVRIARFREPGEPGAHRETLRWKLRRDGLAV